MRKRSMVIWGAVAVSLLLLFYSPILWAWSHRDVRYWGGDKETVVEEIQVKWNVIIYHVSLYGWLLDRHAAMLGYREIGFAGASEDSIAIYGRVIPRPTPGETPSKTLP